MDSKTYNNLQTELLSVIENDHQVSQIIEICDRFYTEKNKASAREAVKKSRKKVIEETNNNPYAQYARQYYQEHKEECNRKRTELNRRKRVVEA